MEYVTEEQQLEAIKNWFKKYGNGVLWSITIILLVFMGIKYWFHHQQVLHEQASEHYMTLLTGIDENDVPTINNKSHLLINQFPTSPYATFAAFFLANQAVKAQDFPLAEQNLSWVMQKSSQKDFQALARVRLMRVLMAQNKYPEALALVNEKKAEGYLVLMTELQGDIFYQQQELAKARESYEKALALAPEEGMVGPLLKMKLEELGAKGKTDNKEVIKS